MSLISSVYKDFIDSGEIKGNVSDITQKSCWYLVRAVFLKMKEIFDLQADRIEVDFCEEPLAIIPSYSPRDKRIYIPILACVDFEGGHFFDGPKDPMLNDLAHVQAFSDVVAGSFMLKKRNVTHIDAHGLRVFLAALKDMENAVKGFKFGIGHELGHYYYQHSSNFPHENLFNACTLGLYSIYELSVLKKQEREADAFSFKKSKELAEGGIYLFSVLDNEYKMPKAEKVIASFIKLGLTATHGSSKSRIKKIASFLKKSSQE